MRMSGGIAEGEVLSSPASLQSGCKTGGWETPCACGYIHSRAKTTSSRGAAWYGKVPGWSSPRCWTSGMDGCDGACQRCPMCVFSVRGQNICRTHQEYRKFLLNLHLSREWMFLCNLLIFTYKDTKNISFRQLFQCLSYTELTFY